MGPWHLPFLSSYIACKSNLRYFDFKILKALTLIVFISISSPMVVVIPADRYVEKVTDDVVAFDHQRHVLLQQYQELLDVRVHPHAHRRRVGQNAVLPREVTV